VKKKSKTTKAGVVRKIIKQPGEPEKAEITIPAADELYREIRVENKLEDDEGKEVKLMPGAPVDITIETDKENTTKKDNSFGTDVDK
jgi:hypothetical protein